MSLASGLKSCNYNVIYVGFPNLEIDVVKNGYRFITIKSCTNDELVNTHKKMKFKQEERLYYILHNEIEQVIREECIDFVFLHLSRTNIYMIPALHAKAKIVLYSTSCGAMYINGQIPPNTSSYVVNPMKASIIPYLTWIRRYIRRELEIRNLVSRLYYPRNELRKIAKESHYKWKYNTDGRYLDFPKIIFSPYQLEFPKNAINKSEYMGLCLTTGKNNRAEAKPITYMMDKKKIYCSFGTLSHRYTKAKKLLVALIDIFRIHSEWQLIITLGKSGKEFEIKDLPVNVVVIDFVDQMEILKEVDLVITHGGLGTLKECIYNEVPMLVFPCSYDQHGNAAKVEYHQIGIRNKVLKRKLIERLFKVNITFISKKEITRQIQELLMNHSYKENISELKKRMIQEDTLFNVNKLMNQMSNVRIIE